MKFRALLATSAACLFASALNATTVNNTDLPNVSGTYGAGLATTVTGPTGTLTTVTGPGGGSNRAGAGLVYDKWAQQNVGGNASVGITTTRPRSGTGSVEFTGLTANTAKADLEYYFSQPISLAEFESASYDWFRASTSTTNGIQVPSLRLLVNDENFTLPATTYLIYEPVYQNGPGYVAPTDVWQTESITLGSMFWNNGGLNNGGSFTRSLGAWLDSNPGLLVYGLSTGIGSGWNGTFFGGVDNIAYNFGARADSFNFEVAAVPEPAAWAMMIGGFGFVGAAVRRRKAKVAFA